MGTIVSVLLPIVDCSLLIVDWESTVPHKQKAGYTPAGQPPGCRRYKGTGRSARPTAWHCRAARGRMPDEGVRSYMVIFRLGR
jgi:hypothetical protein